MRQAVMTAPGRIELRDATAPEPGAGEALIRIRRIGVCGSDVHVWHGVHPFTGYPVVQGHEFSGEIVAAGEGVDASLVGRRATALPQEVCGRCRPCRRGDRHICESLKVRGFQAPGCAQELFAVPVASVVTLPDDFTHEQGALVEPAAVAAHAVSRAGELSGRNVAVLGAGPIGNLVAQAARTRGANVLITDVSAHRLDVAKRCGLTQRSDASAERLGEATARTFADDGFDVAFDCAGVEATISAAVSEIAKGGRIVVVAVFDGPTPVDLSLVQDRELELVGTLMYRREDYEQAIAWIASGALTLEPLMGRHFDLADYADAYGYVDSRGDEAMKVFIDV